MLVLEKGYGNIRHEKQLVLFEEPKKDYQNNLVFCVNFVCNKPIKG